MKQHICILIALLVTAYANAQTATPFDRAYAKWKTSLHMSPFSAAEDSEIRKAVGNGECRFAGYALFEIGRAHLPGAVDLADEQIIEYGESVDALVEDCKALKAQTLARM